MNLDRMTSEVVMQDNSEVEMQFLFTESLTAVTGNFVFDSGPCEGLDGVFHMFKQTEWHGIPDAEVISVVDIGLLSQVYANLFSNALKYTQKVVTDNGDNKKSISYGREIIRDFFGPGKDGLKYNVFSTGAHINPEEREKIFEDGYRGTNIGKSPGTGHGLTFIKNAIEMHGGTFGYEATQYGNNFFFIIPK